MMVRSAPVQAEVSSRSFRVNNFDLIRLFAALQVMIGHGLSHLKVTDPPFFSLLSYLPGVPIFFIISGFLISLSWERAPSLQQYVLNRVLRIYPALWVCLVVSIAIFLGSGVRPDSTEFWVWFLAQFTFVQFYNPDFLREFGIGVINGSLWTIPVELEFYILLPLLALAAKQNRWIWAGFTAIAAVWLVLVTPYIEGERQGMLQKLLGVSIIPYLVYFLIGVMVRQSYAKYPRLFQGKGLVWCALYALWVVIEVACEIPGRTGHELNILSIILLGMLTVSLAFSKPNLAKTILKNNDMSYGVYIYHTPIINLLVFYQMMGVTGFTVMFVTTIIAATLSWRLIEKRALSFKNYSLLSRSNSSVQIKTI